LLQSDDKNPSARSRDHQIIRRAENMLTLAGGKYTTYRLIAKQAVDEVYKILDLRPPKCQTATTPIPDYRPTPAGEKIADAPEVYASDIEQAAKNEMAITVEDIMHRRTGLALSRFGGADVVEKVERIAALSQR
jgi:glycerol-3-phosphate dehydrogenase